MGSDSRIVKADFRKLNAFVKGLGEKRAVKLGIFGSSGREGDAGTTNADIAAVHELGSFSAGIPARSFLRMPLFHKTEEILKATKKGADKLLAEGNVFQVLVNMGLACEVSVARAFSTMGFGLWKALKAATIRRKGSELPLIDTGQLRRSVTSKVEAD